MVPRAQCETVLASLCVDWLEASKGVGAGTATWDSTVEASVESADFPDTESQLHADLKRCSVASTSTVWR